MVAVPAVAIYTAHPGNTDSRSQLQLGGCAFDHFPYDLMAGNESRPNRRQIFFHDVQIGSTHSAGDDPK